MSKVLDSSAYNDMRVEAIGADWVVLRSDNGASYAATFDSREDLDEFLAGDGTNAT